MYLLKTDPYIFDLFEEIEIMTGIHLECQTNICL